MTIAERRVHHQLLGAPARDVLTAVRHLGAVQAQDYPGALWAIGQRSGATHAEVEAAIARREIVRTWPMRGTLHFVPAEDARWMLALDAERRMKVAAGRHRELGLTEADFAKASRIVGRVFGKEPIVARRELLARIAAGGVSVEGQRGAHLLVWLSLNAEICCGPHRGKTPTFVQFDEWLANAKSRARDESLSLLALRYFTSHGPATLADFAWWSGRTMAEARRALDAVTSRLARDGDHWGPPATRNASSRIHLLAGFDEMLLGYRDRSATLAAKDIRVIAPGNGLFRPTVIDRGRVVGTWSRDGSVAPFDGPLPAAPLAKALRAYRQFLGTKKSASP